MSHQTTADAFDGLTVHNKAQLCRITDALANKLEWAHLGDIPQIVRAAHDLHFIRDAGPPEPVRQDEPRLGLATTEDLYRELIARETTSTHSDTTYLTSINRVATLAETLGGLSTVEREYRTVG
jgi:hypothetical protein